MTMTSDCPDCEGTYTGTRCRCGYELEIKPLRETSSKEPLPVTSEATREAMRGLLESMKMPDKPQQHEKPGKRDEVKRQPANQDYFKQKGWAI